MSGSTALDAPDAPERADLQLALVPLFFAGGYAVAALAFDGWTTAVATAALAASLPVVDGLFVHPPHDR
ncbi:hypothetical protein EXE53_22280 [Halorubrum sp. SD626R]|uniref:hypothetical protein n=1 Tax=Halorubrum TaxID=56688 RepID=UPI0010F8B73B|nr:MULTISPECIES: hypothetical protein [Halorubrum]TKX78239.1 hypothetical protein EXE53_22280 [Halorubrum sp. SD626R]